MNMFTSITKTRVNNEALLRQLCSQCLATPPPCTVQPCNSCRWWTRQNEFTLWLDSCDCCHRLAAAAVAAACQILSAWHTDTHTQIHIHAVSTCCTDAQQQGLVVDWECSQWKRDANKSSSVACNLCAQQIWFGFAFSIYFRGSLLSLSLYHCIVQLISVIMRVALNFNWQSLST